MSSNKIILVTGANRGIGLEICKQLDESGHTVILCSRDFQKGEAAAMPLGRNVTVKQLDVTNEESIQHLFEFVKNEFGRLDVLINNAGVGSNPRGTGKGFIDNAGHFLRKNFDAAWQVARKMKPLLEKAGLGNARDSVAEVPLMDARLVMETNLYGPWRMMQIFLPLLRKSEEGRIINVSSGMGELKSLAGDYPAYRLSKASLNALTLMFASELSGKKIKVNAMCPGWVRTDMGGPDAPRDVSQGADTAVWLATEKDIPSGKFFQDRQEVEW